MSLESLKGVCLEVRSARELMQMPRVVSDKLMQATLRPNRLASSQVLANWACHVLQSRTEQQGLVTCRLRLLQALRPSQILQRGLLGSSQSSARSQESRLYFRRMCA